MSDKGMEKLAIKPLLLTMGDPAGIGPEIVVKALLEWDAEIQVVVVGDQKILRKALDQYAPDWGFQIVKNLQELNPTNCNLENTLYLLESSVLSNLPPIGEVSSEAGRTAYEAIAKAILTAKSGEASGIITAPIHKEALAQAGLSYPGHTEILADLGGSSSVAMMLANEDLRTVLVTVHCSLREAIERADYEAQLKTIRMAQQAMKEHGFAKPRIAVAGLNPHAGEGGLFGGEEINIIRPAIKAAQAEGIDVSGPWPGDTVFMQARQGKFDVVVAQYHDQGLIPIKYMGLEKGVNVTLGLPFVRTSPDHGTAFDIAGRGIADPASLSTALKYAADLVANRKEEIA